MPERWASRCHTVTVGIDERKVVTEQRPGGGVQVQCSVLHQAQHGERRHPLHAAGDGELGVDGVRHTERSVGQPKARSYSVTMPRSTRTTPENPVRPATSSSTSNTTDSILRDRRTCGTTIGCCGRRGGTAGNTRMLSMVLSVGRRSDHGWALRPGRLRVSVPPAGHPQPTAAEGEGPQHQHRVRDQQQHAAASPSPRMCMAQVACLPTHVASHVALPTRTGVPSWTRYVGCLRCTESSRWWTWR